MLPKNALLESLKSVSKVSKHSKLMQTLAPVLAITIAIVLMLIFTSHGHSKKTSSHSHAKIYIHSNDTLAENLKRLKAMQTSSIIRQDNNTHLVNRSNDIPVKTKLYLARQNAPTLLYHAQAPKDTLKDSSTNHQSSKIFLGDSSNTKFANKNSIISETVHAKKIEFPNDTLLSGEFLHATTESAINSDLPGLVRAVVSRPVYSYTGEKVLVAAGSRLVGQYNSSTTQGINRVFVIWSKIILPNGVVANINSPSNSSLGEAGQRADSFNTHFWTRFGQASLLSIIGTATSNVGVSSNDEMNSSSEYRTAIAQSFQDSASDSFKETANIKPTLKVNQGTHINIFIAQDISFHEVNNA